MHALGLLNGVFSTAALLGAVVATAATATPSLAQRGGGRSAPAPVAAAPGALPQSADSVPYIRRTPPADPVIQRMWVEGTQHSEVMRFSQQLFDSMGPRLTASPDMELAQHWLLEIYRHWGITAGHEQYGTWNSWRKGVAHLDLITPRVRSLEVALMAWSPGTNDKWVEGEVVIVPPSVTSAAAFKAWMPNARGKFVLVSAPRLSCRMDRQWEEFGTEASRTENATAQAAIDQSYNARIGFGGGAVGISDSLKSAGALGVLSSSWSGYPGVDKIFGSPRQRLPAMDVGCEDYGLLYRLADNNQHPLVRMVADAEFRGELPVYNVIAEIRGVEKPNEYVMMSAHFDSWAGASGATDNGTGTVTMLEAMRIIKAAYPHPKRTILVGHWSGEEQGLNGSRGYVEDHPEVVAGLQALWNQDNGTGRVTFLSPGPFSRARPVLARYLGELPSQITQWVRLGDPTPGPATGGSDQAGFQCAKAPAFSLGALAWDYSNTTWHTNRDTYDKVVPYDLRNNAMLVAMLTYLASEDPQRMPKDVLNPLDTVSGKPAAWPNCPKAIRVSSQSMRQ